MALSPSDERLLWALEHVCKHKTLPMTAKLEVARFVASVAPRALDVARGHASGPLALLRCAVHTNGFTTLTTTAANACADDLLTFARSSEVGASLAARAREIAERARCEYAFGQLRTGNDGFGASPSTARVTSPGGSNQQWRLVENFWMRWNDVRADAMFAEDGKKLVGSRAREAYLFVEGVRKQGGKLPGTWESVAEDPMEILDAMGELCEDAMSTFGDSFLNNVAEDVRRGVYQVKVVKGLIENSGRVTDASVDEAIRRSTNVHQKLSSAATTEWMQTSGDGFTSPPKRVHIAAERKANARTVEWDSQMDQDASPEPLTTIPWDTNVSQRTPRSKVSTPAEGTPRLKRLKWTDDEVDALRHGVEKYGVGKWKFMLRDPTLFNRFHEQRTSVDLKDKWRVMSK